MSDTIRKKQEYKLQYLLRKIMEYKGIIDRNDIVWVSESIEITQYMTLKKAGLIYANKLWKKYK